MILSHTLTQSFRHSHTLFTHFWHTFYTLLAIFANFSPISTVLVSESIYTSWQTHWWRFDTTSHTPSGTLTHYLHTFGYFKHCSTKFNKFGVYKYVYFWGNSLVMLLHFFIYSFTLFHTIFTHFRHTEEYFGKFCSNLKQCASGGKLNRSEVLKASFTQSHTHTIYM